MYRIGKVIGKMTIYRVLRLPCISCDVYRIDFCRESAIEVLSFDMYSYGINVINVIDIV